MRAAHRQKRRAEGAAEESRCSRVAGTGRGGSGTAGCLWGSRRHSQGRLQQLAAYTAQGQAQHVVLSGAHPGDGLRVVSEAHAMARHAQALLGVNSLDPTRCSGPYTNCGPSDAWWRQSRPAAGCVWPQGFSDTRLLCGRWVLEDASTSTRENAVYSLRIAKEHG